MTEDRIQEGYPFPGDTKKPLKITGQNIEYIVIAPKGYAGEYPAVESELKDYPAPSEKPLKITAENIEWVVVVPKGYPTVRGTEPRKEAEKEAEKASDVHKKLEEELNTMKTENENLKKQIEEMLAERKENLAKNIVELRKEKGLIEDQDIPKKMCELKKLGVPQLQILLSDSQMLRKLGAMTEAKVKLSQNTEVDEVSKLRKEWFGHSKPLNEKGEVVE